MQAFYSKIPLSHFIVRKQAVRMARVRPSEHAEIRRRSARKSPPAWANFLGKIFPRPYDPHHMSKLKNLAQSFCASCSQLSIGAGLASWGRVVVEKECTQASFRKSR